MSNAQSMIATAASSIGMREPNAIQAWYRSRNGNNYAGNFPWCNAAITYWAFHSGNHQQVCPFGDRAYTPLHAGDFKRIGRWHAGGGADAQPGDIIFFDNPGGESIDHVGLVERNLGDGRLITIEGNWSNRCDRVVRRVGSGIAGYGRPAYSGGAVQPPPPPPPPPVQPGALAVDGHFGPNTIRALQRSLRVAADGDFGPTTKRTLQQHLGVPADGIIGPATIRALQARLGVARDGDWGPATTRALQSALNAGRF